MSNPELDAKQAHPLTVACDTFGGGADFGLMGLSPGGVLWESP